ncbi:MAG: transketolase, partial [Bacteroidia bacterium]|nr:transketolase [Bacteroidia bacterium]
MAEDRNDIDSSGQEISFESFQNEVLNDYRIVCESREASLLGRREVLTGKAKFGIFGDGKELAQIAMAKNFRPGDFRSGYYRDQTFMAAAGLLTWKQFFGQLYAHPEVSADPFSAGRMMNAHFATRSINGDGEWNNISDVKNSSADISPTAGQMPRLLGLAYASIMYRHNPELVDEKFTKFSKKGNEVAFGTIGDASTSEGCFYETINAAGVLQVPMAVSVWDDGYGISVPSSYQTTKQSISEVLAGFAKTDDKPGYLIYTVKGWDYAALCSTYEEGVKECRDNHIPVIFHVQEMTQPQGHSTSGSHERYKSPGRLQWEQDFDCIAKLREYILSNALGKEEELVEIENAAKKKVRKAKSEAWNEFSNYVQTHVNSACIVLEDLSTNSSNSAFISKLSEDLKASTEPFLGDVLATVKKALRIVSREANVDRSNLLKWIREFEFFALETFSSHLYNESSSSALRIEEVKPEYNDTSPEVDGREVILNNFDVQFSRMPNLLAFGEDLGHIGGVNQTYAGLQEKYGSHRIFDTGIRETTIVGQGVGMALRGLRPIAEIQYLDYLLYALQTLSDDLATLQYRTRGGQRAPLIISTRGHRLEGIWHSGSPMGMILGSLRG